jgi:hypothetical protein
MKWLAQYLTPRLTRNWYVPPKWSWWIQPSGGDVAPPKPWSVWDYLLESPLGAHTLGSLLAFGIGAIVTGDRWEAYAFACVWSVIGQGQKFDALAPLGRYNWREVVWRLVIGLVPLGVALLLL